MEILVATHNLHKKEEIQQILGEKYHITSLTDYHIHDEIIEDGKSFHENALIKAKFCFEKTGKPSLGDDSGLVVPALDGRPGIYSARYAGNHDFDKNMEEFRKIQEENNLFANWSYYEISPSDINKKHSFKNITSISYEGITIPFNKANKPKTWLDLWKISDQIMRQSGDTHHCFLEGWNFQDSNLDVITGS